MRCIYEDASLKIIVLSAMNLCAQNVLVPVFPALGVRTAGVLQFFTPVNEPDIQNRHPDPAPDQELDLELFRRIGARDRAAFAEFYDRHSARLYSIAHRILNDPIEAQDVLQESFMQIWEKAGDFDPKLGRPSFWVVTVVRNKAIDRIRASQRRTRLAESAGVESGFALDGAASANEAVHSHEKAALIRSAIVELPDDQRKAIEMAFFSGLTQNEISAQLSQPLGTIKARIRRGLLKLREQLEGVL
jgi:RNA polymerase sigma-70 factor (ECF subfamily)